MLLYEFLMRFGILNTDTENLGIMQGKCARLIPERANLRRSATGEILGIKRQNDISFLFKLTQLIYLTILVGGDKIRCRLSDFKFTGHVLLDELDDICSMIRNVNVFINDSDIPCFVDNERNALGGVEPFHYPAINFADRKFGVCKQ